MFYVGAMQYLRDSICGETVETETVHKQVGHGSQSVCLAPDVAIEFAVDNYYFMAGQAPGILVSLPQRVIVE